MMVKEFIAWLQTQDQDATVRVLVQSTPPPYESFGSCDEVVFTPDLAEYLDMRGNPFAQGKPYGQDHDLILGQKD
jgi:hypothetical protein